jgi:hypothetical protein
MLKLLSTLLVIGLLAVLTLPAKADQPNAPATDKVDAIHFDLIYEDGAAKNPLYIYSFIDKDNKCYIYNDNQRKQTSMSCVKN